MALLTKAQVRTAVQQVIDDAGATRWAAANLDILIGLVQDTLWQQVLDTYPWFLSVEEAETPSAGGIIDITTALTVPGRMYRIQAVKLAASPYTEYQPQLYTDSMPQTNTYWILGDEIQVKPAAATALTVTYSFLPTKFDGLATDATVLDQWPEGHEAALIYSAGAWAMSKGDAEQIAQIGRIADHAVEAMLDHCARRYPVAVERRNRTVKGQTVSNPLLGKPSE